ncbi:hypothetical protein E1B28_003396 [Marasmius oreades]|uniref:Meiotically up-regulated protein Msb1/Mug8 domain-containing protein n=1 Tax=Marasmius oreades TaxID=181124 RepID=A0A9P7UJT1_9AGAR|nr:uncharacterized protein E1B28_003396 [Marasmius oreades]KAG7085862.1 hypothetical protein E1B28_003396 [Marasmius oreades]
MPPFLSKVWFRPRKKQDKDQPDASRRVSDPSLLEGKFERVSPNLSPVGDSFSGELAGSGHEQEKEGKREKDKGGRPSKEPFSLLRSKSAEPSASSDSSTRNRDYYLPLNLPGPKGDSRIRPLGVVFEGDADPEGVLSDAVIGRRQLSPQETLTLVRVCSQEIMARGLETLGIMHPHWYSASRETQRRIISLFIQSLATNGPPNTLSTDTSPSSSSFDSQIVSTRPHDVAAVLRWAVRHLQLEGSSFGIDKHWYQTFFDAERNASYPPRAFTEKLVPLVSKHHLDLLNATLALVSSLAAHAEANSISGSKLSMLLGLCLFTSQRSEAGDDWQTFYTRWERNGRMLEHLFLCQIRDEAAVNPVPKRLTELTRQYPYSSAPSSEGLLARSRFSTLRYDALYVRVESELPHSDFKPTKSLIYLLQTALKAELIGANGETKVLWEKLRQVVSADGEIDIYKILSDETIQLFSLADPIITTGPALKLDIPNGGTRRRSLSLDGREQHGPPAPSSSRRQQSAFEATSSPTAQSSGDNQIGLDWSQFSTSGFLDSGVLGAPLAETLLDKDLEVTKPPSGTPPGRKSPSRKSSERRGVVGKGRKSLDALPPITIPNSPTTKGEQKDQPNDNESTVVSRTTQVSLVKLDEAFIDFWADAVLDPISESWPRFAICRLVPLPGIEVEVAGKGPKPLEWMVVEQKLVKPTPPPEPVPSSAAETVSPTVESSRPTSPRPSMKSFGSSAKKRFTFWSSSDKDRDHDDDKGKSKKKGVSSSPKVGEMGEILKEEDEGPVNDNVVQERKRQEIPALKEERGKVSNAGASAGAGALATGIVAAGVATGATSGAVDEGKNERSEVEPAEEKVIEAPKEMKVNDEGDESKIEEKVAVSESDSTADITAAAAGVVPGSITEDEKKETESHVVSDAQVKVPDDAATTTGLADVPTAGEFKTVNGAGVSAPVALAVENEAEVASPPGLNVAKVAPPTSVDLSSEPIQATQGVIPPSGTAAPEEVTEAVVPSIQPEEVSPVEMTVADEVPVETAAVVSEHVGTVEEVSPPVETPAGKDVETAVEAAPPVEKGAPEEANETFEHTNGKTPMHDEKEAPATLLAQTSDVVEISEPLSQPEATEAEEVASEVDHVEEAHVKAVVEPPAEVSPREVVEETTAEAQEPKSIFVDEELQSHPVAISEEKVEVESEPVHRPADDSNVPGPVTQEGLEESKPAIIDEQTEQDTAVSSEPQVLSSDVPVMQSLETQDETVQHDPQPIGTDVEPISSAAITDIKDDDASAVPPEDTKVGSVPQSHTETVEAGAVEDVAAAGDEEAKQVTSEHSLEDSGEVMTTNETIEPAKKELDGITSNGHTEAPLTVTDPVEGGAGEKPATVEEPNNGKKIEPESPLTAADVLPQVLGIGDDEEGVKGAPVLAEYESQATQLTDEIPPVEDDKVQVGTEAVEKTRNITDETYEHVESEAAQTSQQEKEVEVLDETLEKKPEDALVHTDLIHDNSAAAENAVSLPPVPVVEAEAIPPVEPTFIPDSPPTKPLATHAYADATPVVDDALPPAPASVVLSGDTPGPEIALSSSEPAAQQLASDVARPNQGNGSDKEEVGSAPTHTQEPVKDVQEA